MYLGVTAGLIDGRHHKRLGAAWMLFEWCIMRQTGQGQEGVICRGAVVTYAEIADEMNCSAANVRKWMHRLVEQGYVRVERDRRGLLVFIKNPKKIRLSKLARPKHPETVQVQQVRPSTDGRSKSIHSVENKGASENFLRSDLTKLLENNNATADANCASGLPPRLMKLGNQKSLPGRMNDAELDERRRELLIQAKRIMRDYPAKGSNLGKVLEMKPQGAHA